jgi:hypothetical protein
LDLAGIRHRAAIVKIADTDGFQFLGSSSIVVNFLRLAFAAENCVASPFQIPKEPGKKFRLDVNCFGESRFAILAEEQKHHDEFPPSNFQRASSEWPNEFGSLEEACCQK